MTSPLRGKRQTTTRDRRAACNSLGEAESFNLHGSIPMAAISSRVWKIIMGIAAVFFVIAMLFSGFIIPGLFFLVLLIVGGAIALLNRGSNTPDS